jgi:rod shape-determining protein MreC
MELTSRHRNLIVLVLALCVQVVGLAFQVKRPTDSGPIRLARLWGISVVTPVEHALVHAQDLGFRMWHNYFYLRGVRQENERLQEEILRLRLEQVRMAQDAGQAQRLQALLRFKEQFIAETVASQVIGSSGTDNSRILYIDKGSDDGLRTDMAVIVPGGIVGKVVEPLKGGTARVLKINDPLSGVGAMLERSRSQGILKGTKNGELVVSYIMSDEKVEVGEPVMTSGGDGIFPKGLPIGRVERVAPGADAFLNIVVKPAVPLSRLEEVLVITRVEERQPERVPQMPMRAADILAQRLPGIQARPPEPAETGTDASGTSGSSAATAPGLSKPVGPAGPAKPAGAAAPGTSKPAAAAGAKPAETKPALVPGSGRPAGAAPSGTGASPEGASKPAASKPATASGQSGQNPPAIHKEQNPE